MSISCQSFADAKYGADDCHDLRAALKAVVAPDAEVDIKGDHAA